MQDMQIFKKLQFKGHLILYQMGDNCKHNLIITHYIHVYVCIH